MATGFKPAFGLVLIGGLAAAGVMVRGQATVPIGLAPISHIGIAVPDVTAAAQEASKIFDLPVPKVNSNNRLAQPDGSEDAVARAATLYFPNFLLELQDSATAFGPIHDTLQQFGQTVHHISFGIRDDYPTMREGLLHKGGSWRGGTATTPWSYLDFRPRLGTTLEPISIQIFDFLANNTTKAAPGDTLGTQPVTKIGVVVRDIEEASRAYATVLGITVPPARVVTSMAYPQGSTADPKAHIRTTRWTHDNGIAIELIEPIGGPSPWSDWLDKQRGNAVHHLTFDVGARLPAMIAMLESKGGSVIYGGSAGPSAYLDFGDKLGVIIELTGTR